VWPRPILQPFLVLSYTRLYRIYTGNKSREEVCYCYCFSLSLYRSYDYLLLLIQTRDSIYISVSVFGGFAHMGLVIFSHITFFFSVNCLMIFVYQECWAEVIGKLLGNIGSLFHCYCLPFEKNPATIYSRIILIIKTRQSLDSGQSCHSVDEIFWT
jgi:hypothetical protein